MRLLCELSNLNTQFLSLSLQITDQLLNPSQFRFEGASGCRSVPAHVPRVSSRRLKLLSKHDQVLFQSRVLGHRLLEFLKEREKRGKIIPRSWHVIVVIVVVVVRQAKVDDTSKTEIYLFLCFSFIYLEEYRLYLETMNGTIKSNFFLRTISLLFIYIYIYIVSRRKSWLLFTLKEILRSFRRMERKKSSRLNSRLFEFVGRKIRAKSIQLLSLRLLLED